MVSTVELILLQQQARAGDKRAIRRLRRLGLHQGKLSKRDNRREGKNKGQQS